jgi:EAL domain-containing protein (putative c-di-GMP-specific phosphodiesterase class I)
VDAQHVVARVLAALALPYTVNGDTVELSASAGLTLYPHDKVSADTLLRHADHALYQAKQAGRNRFQVFDVAQDTDTSAHYQMLASVTQALAQDELVLFYQPKVNMRSGQVLGFEALLRWQHPRDGMVPPLSFLPLVEESNLIIDIGEWVIDQALKQLACWAGAGHIWPVSVNIAARHFHQTNFAQRLQLMLARHPSVSPQWLDIEVLESVAMRDIQQVQKTIEACQALGVTFSLDDFGTGYSSLSYLKNLPTQTIKIDRAFIRDILDDKDDLALTEAIITLSTVFDRQVVAEGVELSEQGVLLMRLGCDVAQGFGIAKPMPAEAVVHWVSQFVPNPSWGAWADVRWELSDFPLLVAQHDHLHWIKRVVMALDGSNLSLTPAQLTDHHQCRFGHWYDGHGKTHYGHLPEFLAIESVHQKVHNVGPAIIRLRDEGRITEARAACSELLALKDQILKLLDSLGMAILTKH